MANADNAFGLKPVRYSSGRAYTGAARKYYKSASVILGIGDPVVLSGTAEAVTGIPEVTRAAAASGTITGVIVGFDVRPNALSQNHMAAADTGYVFVCDDPDVVFEIQEDSVGSNLAVTDVGEFCDLATVGNASTSTGRSSVELDSSNAGTGDQLRIMGLAQRDDNAIGANAVWEVMINEHTYKAVSTPI